MTGKQDFLCLRVQLTRGMKTDLISVRTRGPFRASTASRMRLFVSGSLDGAPAAFAADKSAATAPDTEETFLSNSFPDFAIDYGKRREQRATHRERDDPSMSIFPWVNPGWKFVAARTMQGKFTTGQSFCHKWVTDQTDRAPRFPAVEPSPFTSHDDGSLSAAVDLCVYGQDALLKAAHGFTDRCHLHLQTRDANTALVYFRAKDGRTESLRDVAGEFFNELLDQRLRALVQRESEPVRNLILAHALSRTSLLDPIESAPAPEGGDDDHPSYDVVPMTAVPSPGLPAL